MEKENIMIIAQLLTGMKDAVAKLEKAIKSNNMEEEEMAKKEIISFQNQIDDLL